MRRLGNLLRKLNISRRIFLVVTACITVFATALLLVANHVARQRIESEYYRNTEWTQDEMGRGIELFVSDINLFSLRLINDNGLYQLLADDALPLEEKQEQYRAKIDELADWSLIAEVVVVDRDGQVFTAGRNKALSGRPDPQLTAALEADSRMLRLGGVRRDSAGTAYLGFGRSYTYYSTSKWMGNLFIYVPEAALYSAVKGTVAEDGQALVLDGSGQVLACADKSRVGATLFDDYPLEGEGFRYHEQTYRGKPSIFAVKDIAGVQDILGGSLCTMTIRPEESLYRSLNRLTLIIVGVEAAVILIALLLSWRISRRVVMPVHRLQDKLNAFGSGDELEPIFLHPSGDELMELEDTYNQMIERITDLVRTNHEEKIEQRKLQLIALQAQINPHFLNNTLDTIVWIAKIKKQKEIEDLAMALAGFFRISLHKGDKYMRVREELEFVRNFVMIQQIRFPEKFEVEYQVEEDILDCKILKIVIQPFVENAIKHGVAPKPGKGHIRITGKKENEDLVFEILDDGVGFREGDEGPKNGEADGLNGYGVSNVDERLKLEYGEDYGVTVTSCPGEGTRVVLRMRQMFYPAAG